MKKSVQEYYLELLVAWGENPLDESEVKKSIWEMVEINFRLQELWPTPHPQIQDYNLTIIKEKDQWRGGYRNNEGHWYCEITDDDRCVEYHFTDKSLETVLNKLDMLFHGLPVER